MALVTCLWVPLQIYDQTRERGWLKSDREVLAKEEVLNALGTGRHAASLVSLTAALTDTMEMISLAKICDTYPEANTLSHTRLCRREHTHRNTHILVPRRWHILHGDRALHIALCTHIQACTVATLLHLAKCLSSSQSSSPLQPSGVTCLDNADSLPGCSHKHTFMQELAEPLTVQAPLHSYPPVPFRYSSGVLGHNKVSGHKNHEHK